MQFLLEALLLVSAVVRMMTDSLAHVDCLFFMGTMLDLTGLPSWSMVL